MKKIFTSARIKLELWTFADFSDKLEGKHVTQYLSNVNNFFGISGISFLRTVNHISVSKLINIFLNFSLGVEEKITELWIHQTTVTFISYKRKWRNPPYHYTTKLLLNRATNSKWLQVEIERNLLEFNTSEKRVGREREIFVRTKNG